jgi:hypothetical protein
MARGEFKKNTRNMLNLKGQNEARIFDIDMEVEPGDDPSLSLYYPSWNTVRRSYFRRRENLHGKTISNDPFEIPEQLKLTKIGSIKMILRKEVSENNMSFS